MVSFEAGGLRILHLFPEPFSGYTSRSIAEAETRAQAIRRKREDRNAISAELSRLFTAADPVARGKSLEVLLNRLFAIEGISVRQPFRIVSTEGDGILEQIDGVIEFDGNLYLVEIKWWGKPLGVADVSEHMVRVYQRGQSRGLFIVHPGYTAPAIESVRQSLQKAPFVLAVLEELVHVFRTEKSLIDWLREKVTAAIADKDPFKKFSG
jgi:restriction system protein